MRNIFYTNVRISNLEAETLVHCIDSYLDVIDQAYMDEIINQLQHKITRKRLLHMKSQLLKIHDVEVKQNVKTTN